MAAAHRVGRNRGGIRCEREVYMEKRLYRSRTDSVFGGVCGGIAKYLGFDSSVIRVIAVILFFAGTLGFWGYVILAIVIPKEPEPGYMDRYYTNNNGYDPNQYPNNPYGYNPNANYGAPYQNMNGYPQGGYAPNGYAPNGYPQGGYPQNGYAPNGYPQNGYPQNGYAPNGYPAPEAPAYNVPANEAPADAGDDANIQ